MTKEQLIKQCKYYKGEEECPFAASSNKALWWHGEKTLSDNVSDDKSFFHRLKGLLKEAIVSGDCTGVLTDKSIPIEKRAIILYLDLWHGKNFPYDDLDVINLY